MGRWICYFVFFNFLFMFILMKLLSKYLWNNYPILLTNIVTPSKPNVWYSWRLKILAIKWWFPFNFTKTFTGPPFCGGWTKKLQAFSRHLFWEQTSKYCTAEFTAIFVCLLLSWSRRYLMNWSSNFDSP